MLFNLAIRNVNGLAINRDTLTGELFGAYKLTRGEAFSEIEQTEDIDYEPANICVTNPPYSLRAPDALKDDDKRFADFGPPPRDKADYAFVFHGMSKLSANGRLCAILPTGVLFRSKREFEIRKNLVGGGRLTDIVGLPEKLFLNTGIPVVLMLLRKSGEQAPAVIIDASQEYEKGKKQNILTADNAEKITLAYTHRLAIERYSRLISADEIKENEYNLNISRYVDTHIPEPLPDMEETCAEIVRIDKEIRENARELYKMTKQLIASNDDDARQLACLRNAFAAMCGIKTAQAPQAKTAAIGQASLF